MEVELEQSEQFAHTIPGAYVVECKVFDAREQGSQECVQS